MSVTQSKRRLLNQTGDTIVEVLIVIVVLAVVIASGYSIAVASLQSIQLAQERAVALKVAEGQLERLKAVAAADSSKLGVVGSYCLSSNLGLTTISGGIPAKNSDDTYANYGAACTQNPQGGNGSCSSFCYYYGIVAQGNNNYLASVRWDGPRGNQQQVQLSYRIYP